MMRMRLLLSVLFLFLATQAMAAVETPRLYDFKQKVPSVEYMEFEDRDAPLPPVRLHPPVRPLLRPPVLKPLALKPPVTKEELPDDLPPGDGKEAAKAPPIVPQVPKPAVFKPVFVAPVPVVIEKPVAPVVAVREEKQPAPPKPEKKPEPVAVVKEDPPKVEEPDVRKPEVIAEEEKTEVTAPAPSVPEPSEQAPLPAVPTHADMTVAFEANSSALSEETAKTLDRIVAQMNDLPDMRVQIRAYASDNGGQSSARRMSLSRALVVRSYMAEKGVKPVRLDVRALGSETDKIPADRVDLVFVR